MEKVKKFINFVQMGQLGHIYNKNNMPRCPYPNEIKVKIKHFKHILKKFYPVENFWEGKTLAVGCGKCWYCRQRYAATWAKRCELETFAWEQMGQTNNWFITLTYENAPLLSKWLKKTIYKDMKTFITKIKNKSRYYDKNDGKRKRPKIPYVWVSELGEISGRPHIHMLIWNLELKDKEYWKHEDNYPTYISQWLTNAWGHGIVQVAYISGHCAAYCFKYSAKNYLQKCQSQGIGKMFFDNYENEILNEKCYQNRYFLKLHRKKLKNDRKYLSWLKFEMKQANYFNAQKKFTWQQKLEQLKAKLDSFENRIKPARDLN